MKRIRSILRSQSGMSILLALLFLLLCCIAGASVLAAASSTAGKISSHREEQQKYFALTSALRLVCDRLAGAEYAARATAEAIPEDSTHTKYTQTEGAFAIVSGNAIDAAWQEVLPLKPELDWLFAQTFRSELLGDYFERLPDATADSTDGIREPVEHKLNIQLNDLTGVPAELDEDAEGLKETVEVTVRLGKEDLSANDYEYYKYYLFLTAELKDVSDNVVMQARAELSPVYLNPPNIRNDPDIYIPPAAGSDRILGERAYTVKWNQARIYK